MDSCGDCHWGLNIVYAAEFSFPFFGIDEFALSKNFGICSPHSNPPFDYEAEFFAVAIGCIVIIMVTTAWTLRFTSSVWELGHHQLLVVFRKNTQVM